MKHENMNHELRMQVRPVLRPVLKQESGAAIQALSLPLIAPSTAFRLRNITIRKPRTFVVPVQLSR